MLRCSEVPPSTDKSRDDIFHEPGGLVSSELLEWEMPRAFSVAKTDIAIIYPEREFLFFNHIWRSVGMRGHKHNQI